MFSKKPKSKEDLRKQHAARQLLFRAGLISSIATPTESIFSTLNKYEYGASAPHMPTSFFGAHMQWRRTGSERGKVAWTHVAAQHYGRDPKLDVFPTVKPGKSILWQGVGKMESRPLAEIPKFLRSSLLGYKKVSGLQAAITNPFGYYYRGVTSIQAEQISKALAAKTSIDLPMNSLSSWSTNPLLAARFATTETNPETALELGKESGGYVIKHRFSPSDIWGYTQGGGFNESVIGSKATSLRVAEKDLFRIKAGSIFAPMGVQGPAFHSGLQRLKLHAWGDLNPKSLSIAHYMPVIAILGGTAAWTYLSKQHQIAGAHKPIIEGLRDEGTAGTDRKKTDFGSGWRGLEALTKTAKKMIGFNKVPKEAALFEHLFGTEYKAARELAEWETGHLEGVQSAAYRAKVLQEWNKNKLVSKEVMKSGSGTDSSTMLNRNVQRPRGSRRTSSVL